MSRCSSCFSGGGCRDFSSRAEQLPSLAAIDVVEKLLLQALKNTAKRAEMAARGEMSREELTEANQKLVDWLGLTFAGGNPHFQSAEDWNPRGLAQYMREEMPDSLKAAVNTIPDDVIYLTRHTPNLVNVCHILLQARLYHLCYSHSFHYYLSGIALLVFVS